ncbi:MAG: response regulator transcription factor [Lachnospiraceae bacterium]|jgi:two-component system OmpR family response regulator|nr:response regulator transcription factor [Lachnospiraceae bacterium]
MEKGIILLVEDDGDIREGVRVLLESEGYEVYEAESGNRALELVNKDMDLIILDIMMPGISGIRTCEESRKIYNIPILFLTAKARESDKLLGLMAGGDDYLPKPFSYGELLGRVKALLRRYQVYQGKGAGKSGEDSSWLQWKEIRLDLGFNQVWVEDREVDLSELEYQILRLLTEHPNKIFSAQNIYESVWKEPYFYGSNNTVMVHIRKLRVKVEKDPQEPKRICTVWGKGYRIG